jgi:pimeloyl-ACP methyl ester carboxylesterase
MRNTSSCYQYRSEAARDFCFAYFDARAAREWPIASEERTVPTSYGPTFVRIGGPPGAPPLVLLPGAAAPSLMWVPNVQALSARYRTFAVDQIGDFGRSYCTRPLRRFNDLLGWLNELFDTLELGSGINLTGISFGGALAARYALLFPGRVNKVVLLAPAATVLRLKTGFMVRLIGAAIWRKRLPSLVRWMFADMARKDPQWVDATIEELLLNMRSLERREIPNPRVWSDAEWASLKVPALFLVGEHEVIYSAEKAVRRLKRVAPQVRTEIIPGAGHDLTFAQAAVINQKILEFLGE